jgi:hypothetical protein
MINQTKNLSSNNVLLVLKQYLIFPWYSNLGFVALGVILSFFYVEIEMLDF